MIGERKHLGSLGEKIAASYLENLNYTILESNYRTRHAEIDIIAKDDDTLCFIEVKTRRSSRKGLAKEAITTAKQKKIILGARGYLTAEKIINTRIRFDVVEVYQKNGRLTANLIKHAFEAKEF